MNAFLLEYDNKKALFAWFFREDTKEITERLKELKISPDGIDNSLTLRSCWWIID